MTSTPAPTSEGSKRRPVGDRPHRKSWREHPASPFVNLSWGVSLLFGLLLFPIREAGAWPYVALVAWMAVNLLLTVSLRAALERSSRKLPPERALPSDRAEAAEAGNGLVQGTSLFRDALRRLRRNQLATLCMGMLVLMMLLCFAHRITYEVGRSTGANGEFFTTHIDHTRTDKENTFSPPTRKNWFGTDSLGRDVFARTLYGGSISFLVAMVGTAVSLLIGITWGSLSGYVGGRLDHYMMRIVDVLYGLPFLFLVILIMTLVNGVHVTAAGVRPHLQAIEKLTAEGNTAAAAEYALEHEIDFNARAAVFLDENVPPIVVMFFALGLVQWLTMARIVRGQVLSLREREFIVAARLLGASTPRIISRHLVPNLLGPIVIYTTLTIPTIMLLEAFLSFLGLGISEPDCSWGSLASEGIAAINPIKPYWWLLAYPAGAICVALFSLNFTGDGFRDALDPRQRQ